MYSMPNPAVGLICIILIQLCSKHRQSLSVTSALWWLLTSKYVVRFCCCKLFISDF